MRTIQDAAIAERKLPDIPSNFYVSLLGGFTLDDGRPTYQMANILFCSFNRDVVYKTMLSDIQKKTKCLDGVLLSPDRSSNVMAI